MKHMTLSVQMVRFSLSLSVAIFFSHKFSENNHRQRECLLEIRTGCGILRGTLSLSLSLSDEGEPQAVYDKLSRNRCYKFAKRMIDGSIYRSIDRSIGDRLVVARFSIFEAMHESSYMNPLSNARDAFRYCKQHVVS
jgi:hypothetical protein